MGLISGLVSLPLTPVTASIWVTEQLRREAERQWNDPARIRRELDEVDRVRREDAIDPEEADAWEEDLIARLLAGNEQGG